MEEKKLKITIECPDGEIKECEGKAIIGFITDADVTKDGDPIDTSIFVGRGNMKKLLIKAAAQLGELARGVIKDDFEQLIIGGIMAKRLLKSAAGNCEDYETLVTESEIKKVEEEEA